MTLPNEVQICREADDLRLTLTLNSRDPLTPEVWRALAPIASALEGFWELTSTNQDIDSHSTPGWCDSCGDSLEGEIGKRCFICLTSIGPDNDSHEGKV